MTVAQDTPQSGATVAQLASRLEFFKLQSLLDSVLESQACKLSQEQYDQAQNALQASYMVLRNCVRFEEDAAGAPTASLPDAAPIQPDAELLQLQETAADLVRQIEARKEALPKMMEALRSAQDAALRGVSLPAALPQSQAQPESAGLRKLHGMHEEARKGLQEIYFDTLRERMADLEGALPATASRLEACLDVMHSDQERKRQARKSLLPPMTPQAGSQTDAVAPGEFC